MKKYFLSLYLLITIPAFAMKFDPLPSPTFPSLPVNELRTFLVKGLDDVPMPEIAVTKIITDADLALSKAIQFVVSVRQKCVTSIKK